MNTVLESRNLSKSFSTGKKSEVRILKNVDLAVEQGEFISVMGPSGSGKSTLLYNISGMDRMTSGNVVFKGREISALPEKELAALRLTEMGFIFQHIHLLKNLSIFDNIVLSGYLAKKMSRTEVNERASALMEKTGISAIRDNDITQASGGQLQRAGICRALINNPSILFGDEPTGSLNSKASAEIMELLAHINRDGTTVMLVTHDTKVASKTDRVVFMMDGVIVSQKVLGPFSGNPVEGKEREEKLAHWLFGLGF